MSERLTKAQRQAAEYRDEHAEISSELFVESAVRACVRIANIAMELTAEAQLLRAQLAELKRKESLS